MTVTQRFQPPFAIDDVDAVALNFDPVLGSNETITSCSATVDGGFTVGTVQTGSVDAERNFTAGAGTVVQAMLTATAVGNWEITFTIETSAGRELNRTERVSVATARS